MPVCDAVAMLLATDLNAVNVVAVCSGAVALDGYLFSGCINAHLVKHRCSDSVGGFARTIGVDTHHREYGPRRHCAGVVVAGDTIGCILVVI